MLKCYSAVPPLVMNPKSQHKKGEEPHTSCYPVQGGFLQLGLKGEKWDFVQAVKGYRRQLMHSR